MAYDPAGYVQGSREGKDRYPDGIGVKYIEVLTGPTGPLVWQGELKTPHFEPMGAGRWTDVPTPAHLSQRNVHVPQKP